VVENGGFRCTPSTGRAWATTIDRCINGAWVTAVYSCTCQITRDTVAYATQCFDIDAPNTARCAYGSSYCAQCDPSAGCWRH
jgi:hypothetical protein